MRNKLAPNEAVPRWGSQEMGAALGTRPVPRFSPSDGKKLHLGCGVPCCVPASAGGICGAAPPASLSPSCRLKPFTSYKFRVKATNDIGDSEYSEESESLTTLQAGPCPEGPGTVPWASPEPHHPLLPRSPRGGPHHPLRHPTHHHIGAHPLAGTVPSAPFGDLPGGGTEGWPCQPGPWGLSKAGDRGCAGPKPP